MRYAEGPFVQVDVFIAAPMERVWALVSDIELPAQFSSEFLGGRWLDDELGVGARFTGRSHHDALGAWETTSFVIRYEPPTAFEWAVTDPRHPSARWWFELDAEGGGTRLHQGMRMGPAPSGLCIAIQAMPHKEERIVARRLAEHERNIRATLQGVKQLAEVQR